MSVPVPTPSPAAQLGPGAPAGQSPLDVGLVELRVHLAELSRRMHVKLETADGVGVTLLVEGCSVFAGSNPFTASVDELQYGQQQGPCLSAVATHRVVHSCTIGAGEQRWQQFTPRAAVLGLRSVSSWPVRSDGEIVGSSNLYGRHSTSLDSLDLRMLVGESASIGQAMLNAWLVGVASANAQVLACAVAEREAVDLAVGLLMDRYTMTAPHARILIGQLAAQDGVSEADAARSVTDPAAPSASGSVKRPAPVERG